MRLVLVALLVMRGEQVGGDLFAGIERGVEGLAAVIAIILAGGVSIGFAFVGLMLSLSLAIALIGRRGRRRPAGGESLFLSRGVCQGSCRLSH
jgi:hypothetical protein